MLPELVVIDFKLKRIICGSMDIPITLSFDDVELMQFTGLHDKKHRQHL